MVQTKYKDKNGKLIKVDTQLKDDEGFIWNVKEKNNELYLECNELLAEEPIYPTAKYCETV